ncbi:MAG: DUF448 domain-containing protein [Campylobacteraceae bacterium]|nr:DUF448 domain-containing protein [Campylobacteraceae bacterium]
MKKSVPIRTCVVCKIKEKQENLYRFRVKNFRLNSESSFGRSFYICKECIKKEDKILKKIVSKFIKTEDLDELKESFLYGSSHK